MIRTILISILLFVGAALAGSQLIAKDSAGVICVVKEKYGPALIDTCTVVMMCDGHFVLVHKDGRVDWFPQSFHSVRVVDFLGETQ